MHPLLPRVRRWVTPAPPVAAVRLATPRSRRDDDCHVTGARQGSPAAPSRSSRPVGRSLAAAMQRHAGRLVAPGRRVMSASGDSPHLDLPGDLLRLTRHPGARGGCSARGHSRLGDLAPAPETVTALRARVPWHRYRINQGYLPSASSPMRPTAGVWWPRVDSAAGRRCYGCPRGSSARASPS